MSDLDEDPKKIAKEKGLIYVEPETNQLFIDLDDLLDNVRLKLGLAELQQNGVDIVEEKRTVSPGGNAHVYLRVTAIGDLNVLSIMRIVKDLSRAPTVFFEKP